MTDKEYNKLEKHYNKLVKKGTIKTINDAYIYKLAIEKAIKVICCCESDSEQLKCNHTWIINHHQGSRYCSKGCDNFEKHTF
tara:strand:- start:60 stop:305 length:246 start_codon:yes stop_codon:yes gene_type:complete